MKVLHLYSGNLYGGIERMLVALAGQREFAPGMVPQFGLCFEGQVARELRACGAVVHMLGSAVRFSFPWTVMSARRRLKETFRREHFDIAICHSAWPHAIFAGVVRSAGIPLVFWAHDASDGKHWLNRRAARVPPDAVIANSRYTMASVSNRFPNVPTEVIFCPVVPPPPDTASARSDVRRELGAGSNTIVIVMASRMEEWKGHRLLLGALKRLSDLPGWECWIAGGPQRPTEQAYLDELRGLAGPLPVKFLGHRTDLSRVLAAADIHCQPNTGPEPFGVAFVEALYAGLPVVSTRMGGVAEIVSPACGILVEPGNEAELVRTLSDLITNPDHRSQLSVNGPARAEELCHPRIVLPMLQNKFQALLRASEVRAAS